MGTVKTPEELLYILTASSINDRCFSHMIEYLKVGMTEIEVAEEIERTLLELGAKRMAFPVIAAAGSNGCEPHGVPSSYKIREGDFLTMDFGAVYKGYCADMTRTVAFKRVTPYMRRVYNTVLTAQKLGISAIRKRVSIKAVDDITRGYIEEKGFGNYYIHGTGHGVGKEVHEEPYINTKAGYKNKFKTNMAVTVEPGIYIPGKLGVRIEDLVIVSDTGAINLNHSIKELLIIE